MAKRKRKATGGSLESDTHGGYTTERSSLPPGGGPQARFRKGGAIKVRAHKRGGKVSLSDSAMSTRPSKMMTMAGASSPGPTEADAATPPGPRPGFAKGGQIQKW